MVTVENQNHFAAFEPQQDGEVWQSLASFQGDWGSPSEELSHAWQLMSWQQHTPWGQGHQSLGSRMLKEHFRMLQEWGLSMVMQMSWQCKDGCQLCWKPWSLPSHFSNYTGNEHYCVKMIVLIKNLIAQCCYKQAMNCHCLFISSSIFELSGLWSKWNFRITEQIG